VCSRALDPKIETTASVGRAASDSLKAGAQTGVCYAEHTEAWPECRKCLRLSGSVLTGRASATTGCLFWVCDPADACSRHALYRTYLARPGIATYMGIAIGPGRAALGGDEAGSPCTHERWWLLVDVAATCKQAPVPWSTTERESVRRDLSYKAYRCWLSR
jgi:hypothetical protein